MKKDKISEEMWRIITELIILRNECESPVACRMGNTADNKRLGASAQNASH